MVSCVYYAMLASWQVVMAIGFWATLPVNGTILLALIWASVALGLAAYFHVKQIKLSLSFLAVESALTAIASQAVFKLIIYDNSPILARVGFILTIVLLTIHKVFAAELNRLAAYLWHVALNFATTRFWQMLRDPLAIVTMTLIMWVPNHERIVALSFVGEQWHHLDFFIMSPGLVFLYGGKPYVDVISQYGVGVVAVITSLAKLFGGFNYVNALGVIIAFGLIYMAILTVMMRRWLGSFLLALAAMLVFFRLMMCHYGVSPLVWLYPSSTPVRFGFDIIWLWALWQFTQHQRKQWLWVAACYAGIAPFWMTTTGACVSAAFGVFLLWLVVHDRRYIKDVLIAGGLSVLTLVVLLTVTLGQSAFSGVFWGRLVEYIQFFAHGHAGGVLPIYESMKYRHWFTFATAMVMPLVYLMTLIVASLHVLNRQSHNRPWVWLAIVSVYGLMQYQYFVVRSAITSYDVACLPFVILVAFWIKFIVEDYFEKYRRVIYACCVLLASYALMTNHNYTAYPNLLNFSRNPLVDGLVAQHFPDRTGYFNHLVRNIKPADKLPVNSLGTTDESIIREEDFATDRDVVDYMRRFSDFTTEAQLIDKYFEAGDKVPLLSSFESAILLQAKRAPFFYHTPMTSSCPISVRIFPTDAAHSPRFLADSLKQLESAKPDYVVMEKIFLQDQLPASYDELPWKNIMQIANYMKEHYAPVESSGVLVVLKRR